MQLGFVSAILFDLSLDEVLAVAAAEGYDCIEPMCWPEGGKGRRYAGVRHIECDDFSPAMADDVRALCEKHGVGLSALGYYPNPLAHDAEEAEVARGHLRKLIDAAPLLGLDLVNTFIGADHTQPLEVNLARFGEVWPELLGYAAERGVRIGIENCPMLFENTWPSGNNLPRSPAVWRRMFETLPDAHFGLNYDPSHLVMQLMDPVAPIAEFTPRIFHTHAKDMKIDRRRLDEHGALECGLLHDWAIAKIPGLGDVDWGRWLSALTDAGFDGAVCVEVEDEAFQADLAARRRALRISHSVLRPLIG